MTCTIIQIKIDSVIEFAVVITTIITECDVKSQYLFRMCSVATNAVTSLEFNRIRCATTLCHFGRTGNGYVAAHFILLTITAEINATSGYVVVLERFGQNAEPASRNKEPTTKKPSFVPSSGFNRCNLKSHVNMSFFHRFNVFYILYFTYIW